MPSVAVLVPCFKRPEYTEKCIKSLEDAQEYKDVTFFLVDDGSNDGTERILNESNLNKILFIRYENQGLRSTIIHFFDTVKDSFDFIAKIDNDCTVPKNWLKDMLDIFHKSDVDILSPNVVPSNAAYKYGSDGEHYRPSEFVGGLWMMKSKLIQDVFFEPIVANGIRGAFHLLNQIILEKEPVVGWAHKVDVQDIGHWSGKHPDHIKSKDHEEYSINVGRRVIWQPSE